MIPFALCYAARGVRTLVKPVSERDGWGTALAAISALAGVSVAAHVVYGHQLRGPAADRPVFVQLFDEVLGPIRRARDHVPPGQPVAAPDLALTWTPPISTTRRSHPRAGSPRSTARPSCTCGSSTCIAPTTRRKAADGRPLALAALDEPPSEAPRRRGEGGVGRRRPDEPVAARDLVVALLRGPAGVARERAQALAGHAAVEGALERVAAGKDADVAEHRVGVGRRLLRAHEGEERRREHGRELDRRRLVDDDPHDARGVARHHPRGEDGEQAARRRRHDPRRPSRPAGP